MNSIFLKLSLTLVCVSSTLSFCSGRERVSMRNSPLRSSQLRSPSAPRHQSLLNLFSANLSQQAKDAQAQKAQDDSAPRLNPSFDIKEKLKGLTKQVMECDKEITALKKGTPSYTGASLKELQKRLQALDQELTTVDVSATSQQIVNGWKALTSYLANCSNSVDNLMAKLPLAQEALPRRISPEPVILPAQNDTPQIQMPGISSPFKNGRLNAQPSTSAAILTGSPLRQTEHIPLAARDTSLETPQDSSLSTWFKQERRSNQIAMNPDQNPLGSPVPIVTQRPLSEILPDTPIEVPRYQHLPEHQKPTFLKRNWKLVTLCTLALTSGLVGGEMKYKLLTRFGTRLFHGATITGQAMKTAQPSWFTKSLSWITKLLWRHS